MLVDRDFDPDHWPGNRLGATPMTTHVTIKSEPDSNPAQTLFVLASNTCEGTVARALKPGEAVTFWAADSARVMVFEWPANQVDEIMQRLAGKTPPPGAVS